jgi:phosphonopyruvate decarboxylase
VFEIADEIALADFARRVQQKERTLFARVAIHADEPPRVLPPRDGMLLKNRFRRASGAE